VAYKVGHIFKNIERKKAALRFLYELLPDYYEKGVPSSFFEKRQNAFNLKKLKNLIMQADVTILPVAQAAAQKKLRPKKNLPRLKVENLPIHLRRHSQKPGTHLFRQYQNQPRLK
jgi:hypothetical protein